MVDEGASKAPGRKSVWVRVPPPAVRLRDGQAALITVRPFHSSQGARTELFSSAGVLITEMCAQRFRLPARIAMAATLATTGLVGAAIGASAAGSAVSLTVHVGYQDVVKVGEWMPVTVDARNSGAGIEGTLEIQGALNAQPGVGGFPIYQQPISLASGATKRIRSYVVGDSSGATVTARIVQNGRIIVSQNSGAATATTTLIGVLSDQATALDSFAAVHPGSVAARVVH